MNSRGIEQQTTGFLDNFKQRANFDEIVSKVHESRATIIDIALYGGIGLLSGYLIKRYSSFVLMLVFVVTGLIVMQQFELLTVNPNWNKINEFLGLQPVAFVMSDNMMLIASEWAKSNMTIVASSIIGFLLGLKIG